MIDLLKRHREGLLYVLFGCGTTFSNWFTYCICVEVFHLDITVSNALACLVGVIFAFVTNKLYVFQSRGKSAKTVLREAISFGASRAATGIIDIFGPAMFMDLGITGTLFGIEGFVAKLISSSVVIILNYTCSKLLVFRNTTEN